MDHIALSIRKMLLVLLYLSFVIFPIIFANKVYVSFKIENERKMEVEIKKFDFNPQMEFELTKEVLFNDSFSQKNINNNWNQIICFDFETSQIILKASAALMLAGLFSFRKVLKIGSI